MEKKRGREINQGVLYSIFHTNSHKKSVQQAIYRKKYKVLTKVQKDVQLH